MLQVDLSVTWPSLGRTRTRAQSVLVSPWGISYMKPFARLHRPASRAGAFTLMEVMVASSMTAVLLVCVLCGVVSLQHSYAATEEYVAG